MITFPIAKINLGLNVVEKRTDGYHNLETVFYPVPLTDVLEIMPMDDSFPSQYPCDLKVTNIHIEGDEQKNLVVKAYHKLAECYTLPRLHIHLHKGIPTQAGMGGGSSDGAYMIRMLNDACQLGMTADEMMTHALSLGADCPFFIQSRPAYAEGVGEKLQLIDLDLTGWHIVIVHPNIPVSTKEAFSLISPQPAKYNCREVVNQPVNTWKDFLVNDFEKSVFALHPEIAEIKRKLYDHGAVYASMSGSGSSVFGLFRNAPTTLDGEFAGMFAKCLKL